MTTECVSIHFPTCLLGNCCLLYCLILLQALNCCLLYFLILLQALNMSPCELFLYCLILLQALNCCPQEDAKRYNRNSFVLLYRLLSRPSSVNLFFLSFLFLHLTEFFFGRMVIINQIICIFPVLSSAFVVFFVLCLSCVLCIFHYNHLFLCLLFFVVIRPP